MVSEGDGQGGAYDLRETLECPGHHVEMEDWNEVTYTPFSYCTNLSYMILSCLHDWLHRCRALLVD